ncbi:MAG: hypothetical protein WBF73_26705, partial [Bradyrhizobium sp.]
MGLSQCKWCGLNRDQSRCSRAQQRKCPHPSDDIYGQSGMVGRSSRPKRGTQQRLPFDQNGNRIICGQVFVSS